MTVEIFDCLPTFMRCSTFAKDGTKVARFDIISARYS